MLDTNAFIDVALARALVARGWSVIPTESDEEKRPKAHFATAKSWRDFSDRLPTDAELLGWFGAKPRRGGVVLHKGQLCIDHDTKDGMPPPNNIMWEESAKGWHEFYRCDENAKIEHDHEKKIDYLTYGSFVRLCEPECLIDWRGEMPVWRGEGSRSSGASSASNPASQTIRETLLAQGWRSLGVRGNREDFSRPGAAHPTKCDASLFDGSSFKVWSTAATEPTPQQTPQIVSAEKLAEDKPQLAEPVLSFCRRGSFALISGDPKAGKTTLALKMCAKKAAEGRVALYCDFENGPALFWHRLEKLCGPRSSSGASEARDGDTLSRLHYLDCRYSPSIDYIAAAMREIGDVDLVVIDCWGLLIAGDGVEDESSNALVSQYFLKVRRALAEFNAAVVILHHTPKSGANEKLCFSGAGASSLQRYVQTIARIAQDKTGAYWFHALCREFDDPLKPVLLRKGVSQ